MTPTDIQASAAAFYARLVGEGGPNTHAGVAGKAAGGDVVVVTGASAPPTLPAAQGAKIGGVGDDPYRRRCGPDLCR